MTSDSARLLLILTSVMVPAFFACSSNPERSSVDASSSYGGNSTMAIDDAGTHPTEAGDENQPADAGDSTVQLDAGDAAHQADAADEADGDAGVPNDSDSGLVVDAGTEADPECAHADLEHPTLLRCTGLYKDWNKKAVSDAVRAYDPGLHLWSDGAEKARWVYLPPGYKIDTSNIDEWVFPAGTKFWKEFTLDGKRIETRLILKRANSSWFRTTYRWSADETNAVELTTGEVNVDGSGFDIPTQSQCAECHMGRHDNVLGFDAVALSSPMASGVTMARLTSESLITKAPAVAIVIPGDTVSSAALGYLHANCGVSCHNRGDGPAGDTGFYMRLDVATLGSVEHTDSWTTGMNVPGYYSIPGSAQPMLLAACDPSSSIAYYRMSRRDGTDGALRRTQMPPLATHKVDDVGLALIADWLNGVAGCH